MIGAYVAYVVQRTIVGAAGAQRRLSFLAGAAARVRGRRRAWAAAGATADPPPLRRPLDTLLATWGVGLMLQQAARSIFGAPNVQVVSAALAERRARVIEGAAASVQAALHHRCWSRSAWSRSTSICTRIDGRPAAARGDAEPRDGGLPRRADPAGGRDDVRAGLRAGRRGRLRADAARADRSVARAPTTSWTRSWWWCWAGSASSPGTILAALAIGWLNTVFEFAPPPTSARCSSCCW